MEWGEYRLGDLFEVKSSKRIYHANQIKKIHDQQIRGSFPYVVRKTKDNGIRGYIKENDKFANDKNTLSFAQDTFSVYFQKQKYFTGNKVKILQPKFINTRDGVMQYLTASFQKSLSKSSWGKGSTISTIMQIKIKLPTKNREIDFDFMENFIAELEAERVSELEAERVSELEAYLQATGLSDYALTSEEEKVLNELESDFFEWGEYRIEDILCWQSQKEINPLKLEDLKDENEQIYPFYGQSTTNKGIISYNKLTRRVLNNVAGKPTILIHSNNQSTAYLESPFYLKDGHGATSVLQSEKLNKINQSCILASIEKVITLKFSYQNKATKIALKNTIISLPTVKNEPDYKLMETLISAVQKLVIKDVVEYANEKVAMTKKVVERE